MTRYYMDIIRTPLTLLTLLLLTACGGGNSSSPDNTPPAEIIFPEYLPKVNPNLSQDSRTGIWMVYRDTEIISENIAGDVIQKYITKFTTNALSIIKKNKDDIAILPMCNFYDLHQHLDLSPSLTNKGYQYTYSGSLNAVDDVSTGYLEVSYINNNQQLNGTGSRKYQYKNSPNFYRHEKTTLYAVKISDAVDFNSSNEVEYSNNVETELHTETAFTPLCISISNRETTEYNNSIKSQESYTQMVQQFALGQNSLIGTELFNSYGVIDNEGEQRIGGMYVNEENYISPWKRNIPCSLNDYVCVSDNILDINIQQNNSSGIAYSAHLDSSDGGYLDAKVSVIIHPFEASSDTQE